MTIQSNDYIPSGKLIANLAESTAHSAKLLRAMGPMTDSDARIDLANAEVDNMLRAISRYVGGRENMETVLKIALAD